MNAAHTFEARIYICTLTTDEARDVSVCGMLKRYVEDLKEQLFGLSVFAANLKIALINTFSYKGSIQIAVKDQEA